MKITLRKASALQNAIQEALRSVEVKLTVELNEFESAETKLDRANAELMAADARRLALTAALYDVRSLVGQANATAGVNERLAKAAYADKRIGQLQGLIGAAVQDSRAVVEGKLEKIKSDKGESRRSLYGYNDTITTGVLVQEQVDEFKRQQLALKKAKQKLNDEILELNVRTEIELAGETLATLTKEGLL